MANKVLTLSENSLKPLKNKYYDNINYGLFISLITMNLTTPYYGTFYN